LIQELSITAVENKILCPHLVLAVTVKGIGEVEIGEVMKTPSDRLEVSFDMKMRVIAYWKVVIQRVGDGIPLYLQFAYRNMKGFLTSYSEVNKRG